MDFPIPGSRGPCRGFITGLCSNGSRRRTGFRYAGIRECAQERELGGSIPVGAIACAVSIVCNNSGNVMEMFEKDIKMIDK